MPVEPRRRAAIGLTPIDAPDVAAPGFDEHEEAFDDEPLAKRPPSRRSNSSPRRASRSPLSPPAATSAPSADAPTN